MIYMLMLIILLVIIILGVLNILYKNTNYYKKQIEQIAKFKNIQDDLEIVNTGSSYAKYAFDYSYTNLKGFNFALQPQSLSYDFKILKQYSNKLKKDCVVLITIPNFVFCFLDYKDENANNKYYHFLNSDNILNYNKFKYIMNVLFPVIKAKKNIRYIVKDIKLDDLYNQDENLMTKEQVEKDAISRIEGWKKQFDFSDELLVENMPKEFQNIFEKTIKLLKEMIDYCEENNFKPVIIVPPISNVLNNLMSKELMQKVLFDNIDKANVKKIPVLNYLYDERFEDYNLYLNSDFLNKTGREKFIKIVISDIEKINLVGGKI